MHFSFNNTVQARLSKKFLKEIIDNFAKETGQNKNKEVSLALVDDKTIRTLNRKYRGKDKVTDVLSFGFTPLFNLPPQRGGRDSGGLGEVIICWPQLKRQAKKVSHSYSQEFAILLIHGLCHLIGYNHQNIREKTRMEKLEKRILKFLKVSC